RSNGVIEVLSHTAGQRSKNLGPEPLEVESNLLHAQSSGLLDQLGELNREPGLVDEAVGRPAGSPRKQPVGRRHQDVLVPGDRVLDDGGDASLLHLDRAARAVDVDNVVQAASEVQFRVTSRNGTKGELSVEQTQSSDGHLLRVKIKVVLRHRSSKRA